MKDFESQTEDLIFDLGGDREALEFIEQRKGECVCDIIT